MGTYEDSTGTTKYDSKYLSIATPYTPSSWED